MKEKLWTVIFDEHGTIVDAYADDDPVCGGGPDLCGGCRDCMVAQCPDDFTVRYDVTAEEMKRLTLA